MVGYKSSRMRKLVKNCDPPPAPPLSFPTPFHPLDDLSHLEDPLAPLSFPPQDVAVLEDEPRPFSTIGPCRHVCTCLCVCVCVCAHHHPVPRPGDPFFPSSKPTTRYPSAPLPPSSRQTTFLARRFHGRENQSVRGDTRFPWFEEDRTRDAFDVNVLSSRLIRCEGWRGGGHGRVEREWNRVKFAGSWIQWIGGRSEQ